MTPRARLISLVGLGLLLTACEEDRSGIQGLTIEADAVIANGYDTPRHRSDDGGVEVGYLTMPIHDLDRAVRFYGALFDWQVEPAGGHVGNTKLPMGFHAGSTEVRLWFRVDDLEPYLAKVRELGGEIVEVAEWASGGGAECRDDQGTRFDLHRPAPGY